MVSSFVAVLAKWIPPAAVSGGLLYRFRDSRLRMDNHVGDVGTLTADALLDLARTRMRLVEPARAFERERQEGDEPVVDAQEPKLARRVPRLLPHDALDDRRAVGFHLAR